ncbi:MAG TPA: hypothetical protein VEP90_02000 [Methylomirabilota bacterium]|nr:hypothetical protein [Methylomirabilota bacterium]
MSKYSQSIRTMKNEEVKIQRVAMPEIETIPEALSTQDGKSRPVVTERIKPGFSLRKDLIRKIKRIAFEEDRHIYEIIEEGLEMVIKSRKKES